VEGEVQAQESLKGSAGVNGTQYDTALLQNEKKDNLIFFFFAAKQGFKEYTTP